MNLAYWEEQMKATIASAAHLAVPVTSKEQVYLPVLFRSFRGQEDLEQLDTKTSSDFRWQAPPEGR
jgi:hypothetical protein